MKGISWKAISPINRIFPSKNNTYFFELSAHMSITIKHQIKLIMQ